MGALRGRIKERLGVRVKEGGRVRGREGHIQSSIRVSAKEIKEESQRRRTLIKLFIIQTENVGQQPTITILTVMGTHITQSHQLTHLLCKPYQEENQTC